MVLGLIKKNLKKGFENLATQENVQPSEVSIFVHTKNEEYLPEYFYGVNRVPKKDENGNIIDIRFKDFLGIKGMDPMQREGLAGHFFCEKFKALEKELECNASEIYLNIFPKGEDYEAIILKGNKAVERVNLAAIFGEV